MGQALQVDVDGVRLVGEVRGDPTRPTIVLVHGYPDDSGLWDRVAPVLADTHRVVTYDVRGHGGSDAPRATSAYGFDHLMGDLLAVVDAADAAAPVHLVGHDWGAIQGWEAVTRPDVASHVASFTAIAAPGFDHAGSWLRRRLAARSPSDLAAVMRQAANSWYIAAMQVPVVPDMVVGSRRLQQVALHRLASDGVRWPHQPVDHDRFTRNATNGLRLYRANVGRLAAPRRDRVLVPVHVVVGRRDRFVSVALFDDLHLHADRLALTVVEGGGHWLPRTHAAEVAGVVAEHVASVSPT